MLIKLDLHVHTDASADSPSSLRDMLAAAKQKGLSGIAVTDHDRVSESKKTDGMFVIGGCEYTTDAGHLLVYFLKEDIAAGLPKNDKNQVPWHAIIERAHRAGALSFWAHPYAPVIERPMESFLLADGIEAYNARIEHTRVKNCNEKAQMKCRALQKPFSAGSDAHYPEEVGCAYWQCELDVDGKTTAELNSMLREALLSKKGKIYGGTAKAVYRAKSQWLRLHRLNQRGTLCTVIPRYIRAALQSLRKDREPKEINVLGGKHETL